MEMDAETIASLIKTHRVRLKGRQLAALNKAIFSRDGCRCVACGAYVDPETKFHHEPCGPDKSDEIEKGAVLCRRCHAERHFGADGQAIRRQVQDYLAEMYGGQ